MSVVFIIKYKDGIILQKRDATYLRFPSQWTLTGGAEEDELPEIAAKRELKEELNLDVPLTFVTNYTFNFEIPETLPIFIGEIDDLSKISLGEGIGFAVFTKNELHKVENDVIRKAIKELMKWYKT